MEDKVFAFLKEKFGREVGPDTEIAELVQDSMSRVELLFEIEQQVGAKLPGEELLDAETVGDVLRLLSAG